MQNLMLKSQSQKDRDQNRLIEFFGPSTLTEDEFFEELKEKIKARLHKNNFNRSITFVKGQALITDIILESLLKLQKVWMKRYLLFEIYT